jgi:NADH-quinone oxidoreductase subunit J
MYFGLQIIGLFYFIVYIGAIAMLFLFSVMILDIKIELKTFNFIDQILLLFSIFYLLLSLIEDSLYSFFYLNEFEYNFDVDYILKLIGLILFEYYNMIFFSSGIILLIALIACILLTNKKFGYYIKKTQKSIFNNPLIINKQIYFSH